jgi:hypothetical protein
MMIKIPGLITIDACAAAKISFTANKSQFNSNSGQFTLNFYDENWFDRALKIASAIDNKRVTQTGIAIGPNLYIAVVNTGAQYAAKGIAGKAFEAFPELKTSKQNKAS